MKDLQNIKQAVGRQPTCLVARHYRRGGAGEGSAFPKTQSRSNLYLTGELRQEAQVCLLLRSSRQTMKERNDCRAPLEPPHFCGRYFQYFYFSLVFQRIHMHGRGSLLPERSSVPAAYTLFDVTISVAVEMIKLSSTGFRWGISSGRR